MGEVTNLPIHGVVPPIADVDSNLSKGCLKHRMPRVSLHVVSGFVEITNTGDVVLSGETSVLTKVTSYRYQSCLVLHALHMDTL